ncbi:MAG TPA: PilZ domain-containing protein [Nitrospiraceae bacterium]|nr:PilZ domain-containing protein [Nitrospiraceae bacterium]
MPKCPRCGSGAVQRVRRIGAMELMSTFVRWCPFRCQVCTHRFHRFALAPRCWKADRRQYERLVTHVRAMIIGKPSRGNDLVVDLSLGGCRLKTDSPLPAGSFLHLRLQPPEPQRPITIQTVVVRSVYSDSLGLEFLGLDPKQKQHLSRFVRELLTSRSPSRRYKPPLTRPAKA